MPKSPQNSTQRRKETWWYAVIGGQVYRNSFANNPEWCKAATQLCYGSMDWDEIGRRYGGIEMLSVELEI